MTSLHRKRKVSLIAGMLVLSAAFLALVSLRAGAQETDRAKQIGGKFMCMCGCSQVLTQCNHVGCTTSASMLKEVDQAVARGDSEEKITQAFVLEFGTKVYAEPPKSGLSLVAWMLPGIYLLTGTLLVIFVIARWRKRNVYLAAATGVIATSGVSAELLARARAQAARDTED
ncbi:MAG: cytochrome c-type biogenesis protein CcmH [Candidatus Acidiferrales bacterium]